MSLTIVERHELFAREWFYSGIRNLPMDQQDDACCALYDKLFVNQEKAE